MLTEMNTMVILGFSLTDQIATAEMFGLGTWLCGGDLPDQGEGDLSVFALQRGGQRGDDKQESKSQPDYIVFCGRRNSEYF